VENVGRRPYIRRLFSITIPYDTPVEDIHRAVQILKDILSTPESDTTDKNTIAASGEPQQPDPHPNEAINKEDHPPRVHFNELNPDSLNILVTYWFHPPDRWMYYDHAHSINMQIIERFNDAGIDFAFPSQTIYHAGDDKRPLTIEQRPAPAENVTK
jgi:MscS family membrane protein